MQDFKAIRIPFDSPQCLPIIKIFRIRCKLSTLCHLHSQDIYFLVQSTNDRHANASNHIDLQLIFMYVEALFNKDPYRVCLSVCCFTSARECIDQMETPPLPVFGTNGFHSVESKLYRATPSMTRGLGVCDHIR